MFIGSRLYGWSDIFQWNKNWQPQLHPIDRSRCTKSIPVSFGKMELANIHSFFANVRTYGGNGQNKYRFDGAREWNLPEVVKSSGPNKKHSDDNSFSLYDCINCRRIIFTIKKSRKSNFELGTFVNNIIVIVCGFIVAMAVWNLDSSRFQIIYMTESCSSRRNWNLS